MVFLNHCCDTETIQPLAEMFHETISNMIQSGSESLAVWTLQLKNNSRKNHSVGTKMLSKACSLSISEIGFFVMWVETITRPKCNAIGSRKVKHLTTLKLGQKPLKMVPQ